MGSVFSVTVEQRQPIGIATYMFVEKANDLDRFQADLSLNLKRNYARSRQKSYR